MLEEKIFFPAAIFICLSRLVIKKYDIFFKERFFCLTGGVKGVYNYIE